MNALARLAQWYLAQCNGDWEHSWGFKIETLDNPGISIDINLTDTDLEHIPFEEVQDQYETKQDWMICRKRESRYEARGAASRFEDMLVIFLDWADKNQTG